MFLTINLPGHPRPSHVIDTAAGRFTLIYAQRPALNGETAYALRAVSGLQFDMTGYYLIHNLESSLRRGIKLFCPGRRTEVDAIVAALIRDGLAKESTQAQPPLR
ncbi:hypothetical protein [Oleiharenicola lentus]|uniref:hypothetical protein n=1 Tax=Oleiharenicola lentus TaxID=2508720 RepID=UPI003F676024